MLCTYKLWAELCVSLWAENSIEDMLEQRRCGHLKNEFLYFVKDEAVAFMSLSFRYDYVERTNSSPVTIPITQVVFIYVKGLYMGKD